MTTGFRTLLACAIVAALVAPVAAQDALAKRVSLDLKAMAPADAFAALASSAGLKVVVDPGVTAPVDILVRNVSARTALTTMCESIGCRWSVAAGILSIKPARVSEPGAATYSVRRKSTAEVDRTLKLLKQPLPADMKFENTPLAQVSERLSQALGIQIALSSDDPALQSVTMDFSHTTLEAGLKRLSESASGQYPLALKIAVGPSGKEGSLSVMIAIGKPRQAKK